MAAGDLDALVVAAVVVGFLEVFKRIFLLAVLVLDDYGHTVGLDYFASGCGYYHLRGVHSDFVLDAGADDRRIILEERHGLLLHGAGHEGAVDAVLLDEWNEAGRGAENFLVGSVDVGDEVGGNLAGATLDAGGNPIFDEFALFVELDGSIGDDHVLFGGGVNVDNFVGDLAVLDDTIRSLNEAVFVNAGVGGEVQYEADVAALWGLDGTNATVVGGVGVADIEAGALPSQTAWAHTRETALVGEFGVAVDFVHQL